MKTTFGCSWLSLIHEKWKMVRNLDFPALFVAKNRRTFFAFYEAMRARRILGLASADSHWAGIFKMVWQISVPALGAEIFAPKVWYNFVKVLWLRQPLPTSWASWGGPGAQDDLQGCSLGQVDIFRHLGSSILSSGSRVRGVQRCLV